MSINTPYSVNYWGSHPEANNDDCYTGIDFATAEEALAQYLSDENPFLPGTDVTFMTRCCAYVEVSGPDLSGVRQNPLFDKREAARAHAIGDALWYSESTWQSRMGGELE